MKIALACSVGGHLTQIRQMEKLYKNYEYFFITEDTLMTRELLKKEQGYLLHLINRKKWNFVLLFIINFIKTLNILTKEKPDVVICTGALSSVPTCFLSKIMGIKLIYIESFAKMHSPTLTGRFVYKIADLFIVQWEGMKKFYPKAIYGGSIY
ncbi:PssD/Cps14F family polysaccharide biosynthesis glycosyltransferase [Paenibacillus sp. YYML68]|uniref:PssD/Cps14F family polysaccharide biosynthesis glycosyltransferase n=1 Tax=Paenibacillus sp. YYML68 TaxID=2909250 RepID=UPI0024931522|nr:PssD/Cps14F family polysaccharide biosynthesis glycosyltransferase [Paenibacillus sp. YYML68]